MSAPPPRARKPRVLSEVLADVLAPVMRRRGFAVADLRAAWPEVVGVRYAGCTYPERIEQPRGEDPASGGVLWVRTEGPRAVLLQHELGQLIERVNGFLGNAAVARIRLVQGPVPRPTRTAAADPPSPDETRVAAAVASVGDETLRAALARLGRGIFVARR